MVASGLIRGGGVENEIEKFYFVSTFSLHERQTHHGSCTEPGSLIRVVREIIKTGWDFVFGKYTRINRINEFVSSRG